MRSPPATPATPAALIIGDRSIDVLYRRLRKAFKQELGLDPGRVNAWLQLLGTARNLERVADHATDIARTIIYLEEGRIVRDELDPASP